MRIFNSPLPPLPAPPLRRKNCPPGKGSTALGANPQARGGTRASKGGKNQPRKIAAGVYRLQTTTELVTRRDN